MHWVYPVRREPLGARNNAQHWIGAAKKPSSLIPSAHLSAQVVAHDGRLFTRLDEKVGWEQAFGRLLHDHHRVPMMHMRSFPKPQPMSA